MPNNPLTQAELTAYTSNTLYPQIPAGYFFASPPTGSGPLAYRLFDASYISIGIINPNRLGTGSTGAGTRYLADDGTWKLVSSISVPTPTLAQVTTAGNTTTNTISVGGLTVDTNVLVVDSTNDRVGFGTTTPAYRLDVQGLAASDAVRSHIGFDLYTVPEPTSLSAVVSAGGSVDTGLHGYYVTFITALGETKPYSLYGTTTTAGNNTVTLTLPISPDPRVTGRKIYRTKAGSNYNEYRLAIINDNTTTTYVDTAADSTLTLDYRGSTYRPNTTNNQFTVNGQKAMLLDVNATYFGFQAGQSITSGGYNVFVGYRAGYSSTTGLSNTFIGYLSASLKTTGDDNVVIGTTASYNATTLNRNVVLGTLAGRYHTGGSANITTMTNSVFIGMRSYAASATPSNTIVIGYLAESLGDNTVVLGNSSIVTTALRGNVLINTTTNAGYKLDVQGTTRIQSNLTVSSDIIVGTDNITNAWIAYTPIWSSQGGTQPNLGDGTLTGFYKKIGKTVFVRVKLNFGLTTIGGDGAWLFSLPVNAASQDGIQFPCSMLDNGFAWYQGIVNGTYSGFTDKSAIIAQSPGGANSSQGVSGAFPFGWGNGDSLQFNGSYECI